AVFCVLSRRATKSGQHARRFRVPNPAACTNASPILHESIYLVSWQDTRHAENTENPIFPVGRDNKPPTRTHTKRTFRTRSKNRVRRINVPAACCTSSVFGPWTK
ncbi:unnamed protein product, partial [Ectocarpus sp. 13 AM-2016]